MAGQAASCGAVGNANCFANQLATAGWKFSRGMTLDSTPGTRPPAPHGAILMASKDRMGRSIMHALAYTLFPTAIGACGIAWGARGVLAVQLPEANDSATLARLLRMHSGAGSRR